MKTKLLVLIVASTMLLNACGADSKDIGGVTYGTYGIANQTEMKNPNIQYEISGWSIFWSVLLAETVVAPIYFIGWDLYQPIAKKDPAWIPGQIK